MSELTKAQELLFPELAGEGRPALRRSPELPATSVAIGPGLTAPELVDCDESE